MSRWVLFLGAGASVAAPTNLPAFPSLAGGVLGSMGWRYRNGYWRKAGFPAFAEPGRDVSPEVLFGTLQGFDVDYARAIAGALHADQPNAAHRVAAAVLESGGMVWTTNVDLAVEGACALRGLDDVLRFGRMPGTVLRGRAGRRRDAGAGATGVAPPLLLPLAEAGPGGLVKFHGTAENPGTLAFADRELMTPLPYADVDHLAAMAEGRTLVFYGYRGADADLADLLEAAISRADEVRWFEPSVQAREEVSLVFPAMRDCFEPAFGARIAKGGLTVTIPRTARAFLHAAGRAGYGVADDDDPRFTEFQERLPDPRIDVGPAPGIVSARLVERFGSAGEQSHALASAVREDMRARRWRLVPAYARWMASRSLYGGGIGSWLVRGLARCRGLLVLPGIERIGNPVITRQFALLLPSRPWPEVGRLADWALARRRRPDGSPFPGDYYYRAFARRYEFRPAEAMADAETAIRGLASARDPERLAGALLESGAAAIYQGNFDLALRRAFELQYRRGRYAIPRWQSWGALIEAMTRCYLHDPEAADRAIARAADRFDDEGYDSAIADLDTIGLLAERVRRALDPGTASQPVPQLPSRNRTPHQLGDLDLIRGDLELGRGTSDGVARAREHYQAVADRKSDSVTVAMAALGLAEVTRREGDPASAAAAFLSIVGDARARGATWLEAQAVCGLHFADPARAAAPWNDLQHRLPTLMTLADLPLGDPRVLWTITI